MPFFGRLLPRSFRLRWIVLLVCLMASAATVSAREILQERNCTVPANQTIEGTLFVLCENLRIEGTVTGDIFGIGLRTIINGTVVGNVYLAGFELDLGGSVSGSLHYFGLTLDLQPVSETQVPSVGGNVLAGVLRASLAKEGRIHGSLFSSAYQWTLSGTVDGEINFWGSRLEISGIVRSPIYANVGDPASDGAQIRSLLLPFGFDVTLGRPGLIVNNTALIVDLLDYTGPVEATMEGTTLGAVTFHRVFPNRVTFEQPNTLVIYGREVLREFTSLVVVGLLGWLFLPRIWQRPIITLRMSPIPSFSFGLLAFILSFPLVFILALITTLIVLLFLVINLEGVAIVVGFALTLISVIFSGVFYFVAIYISRLIFGWAIGRFALRSVRAEMSVRNYALGSLTLGTAILAILISLPNIGWVFNALALFFGLGAILLVGTEQLQQVRGVAPTPASAPYAPNALRVAVPVAPVLPNMSDSLRQATPSFPTTTSESSPGMDNLPPGFDPDKFFRG